MNGAERHPTRQVGALCFKTSAGCLPPMLPIPVRLRDVQAQALAELLPLLLCGEESAVLTFGVYSQDPQFEPAARRDFARIENDEARHSQWLQAVRQSLPPPRPDPHLHKLIQHFYLRVRSTSLDCHFAQVAALDRAACVILSELCRRPRPVGCDSVLAELFGRIRRDEACHVAIARAQLRALPPSDRLELCASETRRALIDILWQRGAALEALEICPDPLFRRLGRPPQGLYC